MIWVLGVLCTLVLVALFFPFVFWVDFSADFSGVIVHVRFFNKHLYSYEKKFGKKESLDDEEPEKELEAEKEPEPSASALETKTELEASAPAPAPKVEKAEPPKPSESEKKTEPEKKPEAKEEPKPVEKTAEELAVKQDASEKEEKRSLTDQEFWTLLLTPEFDTRAWWSVRHELSALFRLFRIRFVDCFVEGIRMQEYENMGYAAALNGFLKSYPYIGDWDFRMDWTRSHEPKAEGHMRASVNVCRTLGLILATLFYGGIVAWTFWRRRAHILKTGELPELGFIRNKIVKMMSEDD